MVDVVEPAGALAGHLHVLLLVFAYGNPFGAMLKDVGCHEGWVGEESGIDIVRLLAGFFLECSNTFKFTKISVHIKV